MAQTYSKQIALTDTSDGHQIIPSTFDSDTDKNAFKYFNIMGVDTGSVSVKFGTNDDFIDIPTLPIVFENVAFNEIWIKPSTSLTIDLIVFLV